LQPTWPPFGRLTDIQVSTHPLTVAESQTGSDETTPDQIRRVVRPLTLTNRFLALLFYLYRDLQYHIRMEEVQFLLPCLVGESLND